MKKIIVLVMLVVGSVSVFSLDHGLITGFEAKYDYYNRIAMHKDSNTRSINYDNSLSLKLTTGYRIENFRFIGEYTNLMHPLEIDKYNTTQDTFTVRINYTYKNFKIEAYHTCSHPIVTNNTPNDVIMDKTYRGVTVGYYREF